MSKRWIGEICLYLMALTFLFTLTSLTKDSNKKKISILCDRLLMNPEFEAVSVGVIANGKVYKFHKGKLLNGESPTDKSLYEIASLTKTFTGTLLAQAILDRKIGLDDAVKDFLHGNFDNLAFEGHSISFRHILTHESGLPRMLPDPGDLFENPDFDTLPYEIIELQQNYSKAQFYQDLEKVRLDTIPGHTFGYSNTGANLLGYVLEEMYQTPFDDLLQEQILQALGMKNLKPPIKTF